MEAEKHEDARVADGADRIPAARRQFLDLIQDLDAIVWEMDARTWRFLFVSDRAEQLLGYPVSRWTDEPTFWQDTLLHPDDRGRAVDFCATATAELRDHELRYRARAADGRIAWLKDLVRVVPGEDGSAALLRGVMVDITAEVESDRSRDVMVDMVERVTDAFFALDRDWRFTYLNGEAERVLFRGRDDLVGKSIWDAFPEAVDTTFWKQYHKAMDTGITSSFTEFYPPLNAWFQVRAYPSDDGLSVFFRDVTSQHQTEEELRRRDREAALTIAIGQALTGTDDLRATLQTCTDAVVEHLDAAFARVWTLNQADQVLELQASSGIYTHLDGPHGRVPVGKYKIGRIAAESEAHLTNDVPNDPRVSDKDWARREGMVSFAGYPLMVGPRVVGVLAMFARQTLPQRTLGALAAVADGMASMIVRKEVEAERERLLHELELERRRLEQRATELARLASALERSNADLDQFAYVASHDLKAPLRGIANLAQWIEEDIGDRIDGDSAEHMKLLQGRVRRMEALIDGILDYSRAGRSRESAQQVDTGRLVTEVVDLLDTGEGARIDVQPPLPEVRAERTPLQQVFLNLIGNAVKYTAAHRPDPQVTVSCEPGESEHVFTIADNGPGIAPEFHDRIWGIFQTLEARDKVEGTGVGLSVVKKIVESRGGRVWIESEQGAGATFRFTWPVTSPTG
jgi:PAS domain S-box-containing protein